MPQITTKHDFILNVLEELTSQQSSPNTTLIICSSKSDFINQLRVSVQSWQAPRNEVPASQEDLDEPEHVEPSTDIKHAFLTPTLHLLATSQNVNLVFCPSINTFRAYISTFSPETLHTKIIIVDVLALHHGTSEFTVQGLSRTFAAVASLAHRTSSQLQLVECKDVQDPDDPSRGSALWDTEVPLLSGSVRIGGAGANWAGRLIAVRRVVERWFDFED